MSKLWIAAVVSSLALVHAAAAPTQNADRKFDELLPARQPAKEAASLTTYPGVVLVESFRVLDLNGDLDGYPDTNETFDLFVRLSNKSADDLTNVVAHISTTDSKLDCEMTSAVVFGDLPGGSDVDAPAAFRLHVHPNAERDGSTVICNNPGAWGTCSNFVVMAGGCSTDADCRRTVLQEYVAELTLTVSADQFAVQSRPQTVRLDLDLDSSQLPAATTVFYEGFESGFGGFVFQNTDDSKASNSLSDGYRCQYRDPDYPGNYSYGDTECYMGFAGGQAPVNAWHVHSTLSADGGRAYSGNLSLHYGVHRSPVDPGFDTYQFSQLDALRTKVNVNLAARVCRDDPSPNRRSCETDSDCLPVGGGSCQSASPVLSFKHQISLVDHRFFGYGGQALDRAVVHVQIANSGLWQKVSPFENIHDVTGGNFYANCTFDPIDDGNDEDSVTGVDWRGELMGPSSTCYPEYVFAYLGNTDEPFDPAMIGRASDGPGLPGGLGMGTWVESRFDLSPFRGRSIKLRFLVAGTQAGDVDHATWHDLYPILGAVDDGWYIDDVRVTETLGASAATASLDATDNTALPGNLDGDARGDGCDCAPADPGAFGVPEPVTGLTLSPDRITVSWNSAAPQAGTDSVHDVLRGALDELPVGSGPSEVCLASGVSASSITDGDVPSFGRGYWYLVRGRNVCAAGTYGFAGDGTPRTSLACP